jgi:peptidoglycan/LPS O-acetylase OafA/YrhL
LVIAWVLVLAMASLFYFNRHPGFDVSALYFMGSYGLGMLARWFSSRPQARFWVLGLMGLVCFALWFDFRWRLLVAGVTALLLCTQSLTSSLANFWVLRLQGATLGKISYAVFLVHYPICMAFNQVWPSVFSQATAWTDAMGLLAALLTSVAMGYVFWRWVESQVPAWLKSCSQWFRALPAQR